MRILILSSSTGGGHDMRARSIEAWGQQLSTDTQNWSTARYQALEESAGLYSFGVGLYNWIQKKCPWMHHVYFNWLEVFQISASERLLLGKAKYIAKLKEVQPDLVISVHAHTNHAFRSIAHATLPGVPFVSYCGEMFGGYGFSRHWVDPQADAFIGATDAICIAAEKLGMPKERIYSGGFLLKPKFYAAPMEQSERRAYLEEVLELNPDRFTLLLSTGANGAQNHSQCITAMTEANLPIQVVALCGSNQQTLKQLQSLQEQLPELPIRPLSYQEDMFPLLQACHAIFARPGTGTTSESIMAGCPILFNTIGGIMPQEWITVKYLRSKGIEAPLIKDTSRLINTLRSIVDDRTKYKATKLAVTTLRPIHQPKDIFEYLIALVNHTRQN